MKDTARRLTLGKNSEKHISRLGWLASQSGREKSPKLDPEMNRYYAKCKYIGDSAYVSSMWIRGFKMYEECVSLRVLN